MKKFRALIWTILIITIPGYPADSELSHLFAPPTFTGINISPDNSVLTVQFSEGVFSTGGDLITTDFDITVTGGQATLSSYSVSVHTAGFNSVVFSLNLSGLADGNELVTVRPATNNSVRNATIEFMATTDQISINLNDRQPPRIITSPLPKVISITANDYLVDIEFDDPVFGGGGLTAVEESDLNSVFTPSSMTSMSMAGIRKPDGANLAAASNLVGGETVIRVFLTGVNGPPDGSETIEISALASAIFDDAGNVTDGSETTTPLPVTLDCDPQFTLNTNPNTACLIIFANGEIIVDVTSGTGDYTVSLAGPVTPAPQMGAGPQFIFGSLLAGNYTVSVLDNGNTCQSSSLISVLDAQALPVITVNEVGNSSCINPNGEISASLGGQPVSSYRFELFSGTTPDPPNSLGQQIGNSVFTGLPEGDYYLEITEIATGCTSGQQVMVADERVFPVINTDLVQDYTSCLSPDGAISVTVSNAVGSIAYDWTGPSGFTSTSEDLTGLDAGDYMLQATDQSSGCTAAQNFTVNQSISQPQVDSFSSSNDTVCEGGSADLTVVISGGSGPYTIEVDAGIGVINNYNSGDAITISPTQNTVYNLLSVTDNNGCSPQSLPESVPVSYSVNPQVFEFSGGGIICQGAGAEVRLTLSGSESGVGYNLLKDGALVNNIIGTGSSLIFDVSEAGTYTVDAINQAGCGSSMNGSADIQTDSDAEITGPISGDQVVCVGQSGYIYSIPDQAGFVINWKTPPGFTIVDGANTNSITVRIEDNATGGTISVSGITDCGETAPVTFTVKVENSPALIIETEPIISSGIETTFSVSASVSLNTVVWSLGDGNSADGEIVNHTYSSGGNYRVGVKANSENACQGESSRAILVIEPPKVVIKNVITANGDGQNDVLWIENLEDFPRNEVTFLDRWGVEVASFTNYQNDWDVTNAGEYIPAGNYLCIVKLESNEVYSMTVTVLRE